MSDYLKEYLIALGFKVDDATYKKFNASVALTAKEVTGLGSVTVATATAIGLSVEKVAREFEGLYYASQRTGASVNQLKSYGFAAKQIGIAFDQSAVALDSFTTAQRLNPGIKAFVGLGGGTGGNPTEQLMNFVETQKRLYGESGYFVAAMNAQLAGIPEATFLQVWKNLPKMRAANDEMKRMRREAGLDDGKLADDSVKFANAWDHLLGTLDIGKDRITGDLIGPTGLGVKALDDLAHAFNMADRASAGWLGTISGIGAAAGGATGSIAALLWGLKKFGLGSGAGGFLAGARGASSFLLPAATAAWLVGLGVDAGETPEGKNFKASGDLVTDIYGWLRAVKPTLQHRLGVTPDGGGAPASGGGGRDAAAVREARIRSFAATLGIDPDTAMRVARSEGFGGFKSSIPGEQSFGDFQLHVTPGGRGHAVGDQFQKETGLDPSDPANEAEMDKFALNWAKAHGWGDFHGAANTGIGRFAGIGDVRLTSGAGGGGDITVNQTNNNHIVANNAREAGETLDRSNDRANGDLVRNLQGATR